MTLLEKMLEKKIRQKVVIAQELSKFSVNKYLEEN